MTPVTRHGSGFFIIIFFFSICTRPRAFVRTRVNGGFFICIFYFELYFDASNSFTRDSSNRFSAVADCTGPGRNVTVQDTAQRLSAAGSGGYLVMSNAESWWFSLESLLSLWYFCHSQNFCNISEAVMPVWRFRFSMKCTSRNTTNLTTAMCMGLPMLLSL